MSERILIVDDDETFYRILGRALRQRGFAVNAATNIAEAQQLAQQMTFDRAIVDLCLQKESGLQLIGPLLALQPSLAILILTGYASVSTAVVAIKQGAINYLPKPAHATQILQAFEDNPDLPSEEPSPINLKRLEWEHLQQVLQANQGNISATARQLNLHRRTLQRKLAKRPSPDKN